MDTHALLHGGGPFIVSGLLMLSGMLLAFVRGVPRSIGSAFARTFIASVSIESEDRLYDRAQVWLDAHPYSRKARNFTAKSWHGYDDDAQAVRSQFLLTPAFGEHLFRHRGRLVWLERARERGDNGELGGRKQRERVVFRMFRGDRAALETLVQDMIAADRARRRKRTPVFINTRYGWETLATHSPRPLDTLVFDDGVIDGIVADLEAFRASRDWYRSMGIPFRRGFLLYGPPGTGKSSLVAALAGKFQAPLYALSLTGREFGDAELVERLHEASPEAFVLLEDLDAAFDGREREAGVTMSGLLNAIDGATSKDGTVLFVSTNHIERLDAALRRPGRLDVQIELGYATDDQRRKVFDRFFPTSTLGREFADRSSGVALTVADLQEYLLERRHDEQRAIREVPDWIRSRKSASGTTSSPTHNESGCERLQGAGGLSKPSGVDLVSRPLPRMKMRCIHFRYRPRYGARFDGYCEAFS